MGLYPVVAGFLYSYCAKSRPCETARIRSRECVKSCVRKTVRARDVLITQSRDNRRFQNINVRAVKATRRRDSGLKAAIAAIKSKSKDI